MPTAAPVTQNNAAAAGQQLPLRPQSLAGPEREPIEFQVNLVGAPREVEALVQQIKNVAEQFLYHWKTFPIGLSLLLLIDVNCFDFQFISSAASTIIFHNNFDDNNNKRCK